MSPKTNRKRIVAEQIFQVNSGLSCAQFKSRPEPHLKTLSPNLFWMRHCLIKIWHKKLEINDIQQEKLDTVFEVTCRNILEQINYPVTM